jgi:hypothetical protein
MVDSHNNRTMQLPFPWFGLAASWSISSAFGFILHRVCVITMGGWRFIASVD